MQHTNSTTELKNAIQLLEVDQAIDAQLLKNQVHVVYNHYKPINLIKHTLHDASSSVNLIDTIFGSVLGLATGYISKKIVIGASGNVFRRILGNVIQYSVTKIIAQNPDAVKKASQFIYKHIVNSKDNSQKES